MSNVKSINVSKKKADKLTKKELLYALEYINKKLQEIGAPENYITFGKVFVPDVEALEKAKRKFYLSEMRKIIQSKAKDPKFYNLYSIALLGRIEAGIDLTIPLLHFSEEEKEVMKSDKGFLTEVNRARSGFNMSLEIYKPFRDFLKTETLKKLKNNFLDFYMNFMSTQSNSVLYSNFAFDDLKRKELDLIKSVKMIETEGIRYGCNTNFEMTIEASFKNPIIELPEAHLNNITLGATNYLDNLTIFDLFNALLGAIQLQTGEKEYFIENSIDKDWSRKYFEYREKDIYYITMAITYLDGYQDTKIIL